jgi:hypothetical protein
MPVTPKPKVPFVVTSHDKLGDSGKKTGWYLVSPSTIPFHTRRQEKKLVYKKPEGVHPYEILAPHTEIVWASLKGGISPLDPMSDHVPKSDTVTQEFLKRDEKEWRVTEELEVFLGRAEKFEVVFYVGGWGRKSFLIVLVQ